MLQRVDVRGATEPPLLRSTIASSSTAGIKPAARISLASATATYAAIEFLAVSVVAFAAHVLYHEVILHPLTWQLARTYSVAAISLASFVLIFSLGFHNFSAVRRLSRQMFVSKGLGAVALSFCVFLTMLVFLQLAEGYSRGTLLLQVVAVSLTVATSRSLFFSWLQSKIAANRIEARRVVLIGNANQRYAFVRRLQTDGIRTVASFDFPSSRISAPSGEAASDLRDLISDIRALLPDDVFILADRMISGNTLEFASAVAEVPTGIHIVAVDELNLLGAAHTRSMGRLQTIRLFRPPLSPFDLFIKRAFDIVFASMSLIALSPLFLIFAIAIKIDSRGPIFFRQVRHGFNNERIRVLKFRSMMCMEDGEKFSQAVNGDPRVTRLGRIMRRTNIDELPQLINVLLGEMSIVGPRPHATVHNDIFDKVIAPFSRRHNVKPGITGWAQVNGYRGATDTLEKMQQRIEYDLQYIDNWSFFFDLKIIAMTLFTKRGYLNAY